MNDKPANDANMWAVPADFEQRVRDLPAAVFQDFLQRVKRRFPGPLRSYLPGENVPQATQVNKLFELIGTGDVQLRPEQAWQVYQELVAGTDGPQAQALMAAVVPKGLRSFDADDADFFLQLLPGPYRPDGLPKSIYFWKRLIEEADGDKTFRVGVICGRSGCGKSSLLKAGLEPSLANHVKFVHVEATPDGTDLLLLRELKKKLPHLSDESELQAALRRFGQHSAGDKLILVIDQFEQYLHGKPEADYSTLVDALEACDGAKIQCLLLIRDDFFTPMKRFVERLGVRLDEDRNFQTVDTLTQQHARRILALFGGAQSPEVDPDNLTRVQEQFIAKAVKDLAEADGRIICVRLALFADMMQQTQSQWEPGTLKRLSGAQLGVKFLDVTLGTKQIYKTHKDAAERVLWALLPEEPGIGIKGAMRPLRDLLAASRCESRPREFEDLIEILNHKLRLISPTSPEAAIGGDGAAEAGEPPQCYQLTHDYLEPSIREWLTQRQRETRQGRAELRLAELSNIWNDRPENRNLPWIADYLRIQLLTRRSDWTLAQKTMMRRAGQVQGIWWTCLLVVVLAGTLLTRRYANDVSTAGSIIIRLTDADPPEVKQLIDDLRPYKYVAVPPLKARLAAAKLNRERINLHCALAALSQEDQTRSLLDCIRDAPENQCGNILMAIREHPDDAKELIQEAARSANAAEDWQRKARLAIVALHLGDASIAAKMLKIEDRPDPIQRTMFIATFASWHAGDTEMSKLVDVVRDTGDVSLRSGICLAVGSVPELGEDTKANWARVFDGWYMSQTDSGTHSAAGWALRKWKPHSELPEIPDAQRESSEQYQWYVNGEGITLLKIPAVKFQMGSSDSSETDEGPVHEFEITRPVFLSDREISRQLFERFIQDTTPDVQKPSEAWEGKLNEPVSPTADHPVNSVDWFDALLFCNWLSSRETQSNGEKLEPYYTVDGDNVTIMGGNGYRLPTEAEWEYACRSGSTTAYSFGDDTNFLAAYAVLGADSTEPGASRLPNAWGLYDMHGNINEWCWDVYYNEEYNSKSPKTDPTPRDEFGRVFRGGAFSYLAPNVRSAFRSFNNPALRYRLVGFRVARTCP